LNGLIIDAILGYDEIIYFTHTTIESIVFFGSLNFGNEEYEHVASLNFGNEEYIHEAYNRKSIGSPSDV
jgi:hypothetical protein